MTEELKTEKSYILACIDGAGLTKAVCDYAIWLAETYHKPVKLLHVIEPGQFPGPADYSGTIGLGATEELMNELTAIEENRMEIAHQQGELMLKEAAEQVAAKGIQADTQQCHGMLSEKLVELESEIFIAVAGIRGIKHEQDQKALGAQLEALVRSIRRPVFIVNQEFEVPRTFMLAYDGSPTADRGLDFICHQNAFKQHSWILARVSTQADENTALQKAEIKMSQSGFTQVILESRQAKPEVALIECQIEYNVDVTVMGAYSHHRLRGFIFGSFTEKMLKNALKPLLLIHS